MPRKPTWYSCFAPRRFPFLLIHVLTLVFSPAHTVTASLPTVTACISASA